MPRVKGSITGGTRALIDAAVAILEERQPISLRGLFYQLVVGGYFANDRNNYQKLSRSMVKAREQGLVDWDWLKDGIRQTLKPSSWSGLDSFMDAVQGSYRKQLWSRMPAYICVFIEKDAMAGVVEPVTAGYDVPLHVVRGYVSASFAHSIAREWARIEKPIYAIYLGDWDPSGLDLERNLRAALEKYSGKVDLQRWSDEYEIDIDNVHHGDTHFIWQRLGINAPDFDEFQLAPMLAKKTDSRFKQFVAKHGHDCAELDALAPDVLRDRVEQTIVAHIDPEEWGRLQAVEAAEQDTLDTFVAGMRGASNENRD